MTLLVGCGGVAGDRDAEIEASMRAVYGLSELALEDKPTPAELERARDRFCSSIALFSGERLDRKALAGLRPVSQRDCERAFDTGAAFREFAFMRLVNVGRVSERDGFVVAEVRVRGVEQRKVRRLRVPVVRRDGRWLVALPCDVLGCDASLLPARRAVRPRPKVLDEVRGSYRRTRIGDQRSVARRRQGRPRGTGSEPGPVGSDFYDDGGPSTWRAPGPPRYTGPPRNLNYPGRSYLVSERPGDPPVYGFIITDRRAETTRDVGIGDTLAHARRRYPELRCDIVNQGTEYSTFPACRARIAPDRYLGFGQNPIRSIILMTVSFDGAR